MIKWNPEYEYLRYDYNLNEESIILDFGGYKGNFANKIFKKFNCKIFVYEPIVEYYNNLQDIFKSNSKITVNNYGVLDYTGKSIIYLQEDGTSIFLQNNNHMIIDVVDVVTVMENFKYIDLLKINVEGSEYCILKRMIENNLHTKCKNIQIQFHPFFENSNIMRDEIRNKLCITHELTFNFPFIWENWKIK